MLVPPASPVALAAALNELLADPELRAAIGRRAYEYSRMVWSSVGGEYRDLFAAVAGSNLPIAQPARMVAAGASTPPRCIPSAGGISRS